MVVMFVFPLASTALVGSQERTLRKQSLAVLQPNRAASNRHGTHRVSFLSLPGPTCSCIGGVNRSIEFQAETVSRRAAISAAALAIFFGARYGAAKADPSSSLEIQDADKDFVISLPKGWVRGEGSIDSFRKLIAFSDPTDPQVSVSVLAVAVQPDFTSLGSFGTVSQVGLNLIGQQKGATLIEADVTRNSYYLLDYKIAISDASASADGAPLVKHLLTILALVPGRLYTLNVQAPEDKWPQLEPVLREVALSFHVNKR